MTLGGGDTAPLCCLGPRTRDLACNMVPRLAVTLVALERSKDVNSSQRKSKDLQFS